MVKHKYALLYVYQPSNFISTKFYYRRVQRNTISHLNFETVTRGVLFRHRPAERLPIKPMAVILSHGRLIRMQMAAQKSQLPQPDLRYANIRISTPRMVSRPSTVSSILPARRTLSDRRNVEATFNTFVGNFSG